MSDTYPVLSVYLHKGPSLSAQLTDVLKPIKEQMADMEHDAAMSLRRDIDRICALKDRLDLETAPAVGIVACDGEGWFHMTSLPAAVDDQAVVGPKPYVRPLRASRPLPRTVAVVVDRRRAWVYDIDQGSTTLAHEITEDEVLKKNYGGWQGYAERTVRGHADVVARRHYQETAEAIFGLHKANPATYLAVGGHQADTDEFIATLHPYLRNLQIGSFVVDPRTATPSTIRAAVEPMVREADRASQLADIDRLLDQAHQGPRAVLGLAPCLVAANVRAVHELIVAGTFTKSGTVCDHCGWLARTGEICDACGQNTRAVDDLVAEIIETVLRDGGAARQVEVASRLDADGLGAALRFGLPESVV
ncbi:MAG: hypothetical protein OEQ47_10600 [Acidimicrobiia bacterium]|nr:hypothetical protein [Acidimicrobiia bacterium]